MTKREQAAQLVKELQIIAKDNSREQKILLEVVEEYTSIVQQLPDYNLDSEIRSARIGYENAAINYAQEVNLCIVQQILREQLAYDLFLCIADDSGISSKTKIVLETVSAELTEMIPKVGEYIEVANEIDSKFIESRLKSSELAVRYAALETMIGTIDVSDEKANSKVGTTVQQYVNYIRDTSIIIDHAHDKSQKQQVLDYYLSMAEIIISRTIYLQEVKDDIIAYLPNDKSSYTKEMSGLLKKRSVAQMFKIYLLEWLNHSGHQICIYCSFTQKGMDYQIQYDAPKRSVVIEPHSAIADFFGDMVGYEYEDTAVTKALVDLGVLPYKNGPVTEKALRAFGLKIKVEYPLTVQYRVG